MLALLLSGALLPLGTGSLDPHRADAKSPSSTSTTFSAGSYIIDMGAFTTTKPTGLQPYGILYQLLTSSHTPVAWVIKDDKTGGRAFPDTGLPALTSQTPDFSATVVVDGAGTTSTTPVQTKSYVTGAFVIAKEFLTPQVDSAVAMFPNVVVDRATTSFSAPVYKTLEYWPKAVLDAQNGAIAQGFYTNAGIPSATSAYVWKAPSQLNSCDDIYVMPHADPTWSTHSYLKPFNAQGGYIWAGCHAVSVLENLVNPANAADRMNFLSTNGLLPFGNHGAGSPPYNYELDGSDPVMQIGAPLDTATQNGSEQIYMPKPGSAWRPSALDVTWDATQADVQAGKSPGDARVLTYGRGFGEPSNGLVMYEAGHSINKGTIGDVPAQRAFFNFLLLGGIERAPRATVSASPAQVLSGATTTLTATISGGSPGYSYQWTSSCAGGTFSPSSTGFLSGPGTVTATYTAPVVASGQSCGLKLLITDQCGRQPFGATAVQVVPSADLAISKAANKSTVSANGLVAYTLTVHNNGSGTATTPTLTDTLPVGSQYVSASPLPNGVNGQSLTWSLADLPANATTVVTVTARALTAGAVLTNTATVSSPTADPNLANNTASATIHVLNSGVSIEKVARPLIVPPGGGLVTFEFVVHNTGTDPLTHVVVTDNPACTTISGPTGDLNGDGVLAAKLNGVETEIWRYTCTRTVTTATADVAASSGGITTGVPPLDSSTYTKQDVVQVSVQDPLGNPITSVASTVVTVSHPSIAVTKAPNPPNQAPAPGTKATFTVTVTNTGNVPLVSVDTQDVWAGTCDTATIPTLAVGASFSMSCDATVPAATSDSFATQAYDGGTGWSSSWAESGGETDGATAGNVRVASDSALTVPALGYTSPYFLALGGNKVLLTRTVNLTGKTSAVLRFSYYRTAGFNKESKPLTVSVSSDGTTWTSQTIVSQATDAPDNYWSTFEMAIPTSAIGTTTRIRFGDTSHDLRNGHIYVDDVMVLSNQVNSVTATAKDEYGNPVTATATASVMPGMPSLSITKSTTATGVRVGGTFTYTVTVRNTSTTTFQSNIVVTDTLPTNLEQDTPLKVRVTRPTYWQTLASDDFGTGRSYSTGTGWAGPWTETAGDTDSDPTTGKAQVDSTVGNPSSSLLFNPGNTDTRLRRTVNLAGVTSAQLQLDCNRVTPNSINDEVSIYVNGLLVQLVNQNTPTSVCPTTTGSFATITVPLPAGALVANAVVEIRANGDKKFWLDNIKVLVPGSESTVDAGDVPALTSAGGNTGSPATFGLAPGATMTFTIPVRVIGAPVDGLNFSNVVQATSAQQTSPVTAVATTPFVAPSFSITKAAIETWVNAEGPVTYRIELVNTGNVALTAVSVTDPSCDSPPAYVSGDLNADQRLQVGEVWRYQCTRTLDPPISTDSPPAPVVVPNTATAGATDAITGSTVPSRTANAEVRVIHPGITITASPTLMVVQPGATIDYTYTVSNAGDIGLLAVTPTAANCSPLLYQSGDTNGDGILATTETWTYVCTTSPITVNEPVKAVSVAARDQIFGSLVESRSDVSVYVTPPLVLAKSAADATSGRSGTAITVGTSNSITYAYTVTNPSDSPPVGLPLSDVVVSDDTCASVSAVMDGSHVLGDTDADGLLDPGETWSFQCTGGTLEASTTNHAFATGDYAVGPGGTVYSNQAEATVTVTRPELTLGKESSSETVRTGHPVGYTYTVLNTGATSFQLSGTSSYLGTPSDYVVASDGTITTTTACTPLSGPTFPYDEAHDRNGNGVLDPGEMLFFTCTTDVSVDTTDAFQLGPSRDSLGTLYTPAPAQRQVFVIDPAFSVVKLAQTSLGGPAAEVPGIPGEPVTYTITVTHTTAPTNDFHDDLEALAITVVDPGCDAGTLGYVTGDSSNNSLLDPGETWTYTCTRSSLPDGDPTTNTVTVTGSVQARDLGPDGQPTNPDDGLGNISQVAQATVAPSTKKITVHKLGLSCDVGQPTCDNTLPGTAFTVYAADPTVETTTGTPLTNAPAHSATFVSGDLVVNHDYWLVETSSPEGFQLLAQAVELHLSMTGLTLAPASASPFITVDSGSFTITITDVPAAPLPEAGGSGPLPFAAAGLLLVLAACLAYAQPWRSAPTAERGD